MFTHNRQTTNQHCTKHAIIRTKGGTAGLWLAKMALASSSPASDTTDGVLIRSPCATELQLQSKEKPGVPLENMQLAADPGVSP